MSVVACSNQQKNKNIAKQIDIKQLKLNMTNIDKKWVHTAKHMKEHMKISIRYNIDCTIPVEKASSEVREQLDYLVSMYLENDINNLPELVNFVQTCQFSGRSMESLILAANENINMPYKVFYKHGCICEYAGNIDDISYDIPDGYIIKTYDAKKIYFREVRRAGRRFFDVYARGDIFDITLSDGRRVRSSIGQLLFFAVIRQYALIDFVEHNLSVLLKVKSLSRQRRQNNIIKKRRRE